MCIDGQWQFASDNGDVTKGLSSISESSVPLVPNRRVPMMVGDTRYTPLQNTVTTVSEPYTPASLALYVAQELMCESTELSTCLGGKYLRDAVLFPLGMRATVAMGDGEVQQLKKGVGLAVVSDDVLTNHLKPPLTHAVIGG